MFEHKIKTVEDIPALTDGFKTIMAHGVFDIVHVGHIRHLIYCKQQADILIVSVTADEHVVKPGIRPYVPEQLRAMNLAALEMVDYVIIDRNPTPIENLKLLKPDIFAKGYEYGPFNAKTREEIATVGEYGGHVIFTPGDVVYSSTAIIETNRPNLAVEKLRLLMDAEGVTFQSLHETLDKFSSLSCHVIGDLIIDSYTYASATGAAGKTPTISAIKEKSESFVGGAGVVALHVSGAGAEMRFTTIIGDDDLATWVSEEMQLDEDNGLICDPSRPTTHKHAFIVDSYQMLKLDILSNLPIGESIFNKMQERTNGADADVIVFSDFRHGIFDRNTASKLLGGVGYVFVAADSQVASRWGNILDFAGADLIMANEREARFALGDQDSAIRPLGRALYEKAGCKTLILKLGEHGAITFRRHSEGDEEARAWFVVDSFARNVVDAVGAGDAFLAYAALAMRATDNAVIATILGSIAAGLECELQGNRPISREMVKRRLNEIEEEQAR